MTQELQARLDSFDVRERLDALRRLAAAQARWPEPGGNVNMHCHSFFSYNARGFSPAHIAWAAREAGLYGAGLCDFDVLDGLEEFLEAGRVLGLRSTVNLETRAYLREFADAEINSPGEPGVTYIMGAGFASPPADGSRAAAVLRTFRDGVRGRNEALVSKINARLGLIAIDYARDVLRLTPAGAATERHIVRAYVTRARQVFGNGARFVTFWAEVFGVGQDEAATLCGNEVALEERVRSKLVKRGGIGYEQPSPESFPTVDALIAWVLSCRAVPLITWLDGTSEGERDPVKMIECMVAKGAAGLNIIPDRNWNIKDPEQRRIKTAKLKEMVEAAEQRHLPINIGTEMNRDGQPFVDDLAGEALRPYREAFLRGARIFTGHTLLLRYGDLSYVGPEATAVFGADVARKNRVFEAVGALPPLTEVLDRALTEMGPAKALGALMEAAETGVWG